MPLEPQIRHGQDPMRELTFPGPHARLSLVEQREIARCFEENAFSVPFVRAVSGSYTCIVATSSIRYRVHRRCDLDPSGILRGPWKVSSRGIIVLDSYAKAIYLTHYVGSGDISG